jgi:hypothetical protein
MNTRLWTDLALAPLAGYLGTKVMEPVGSKLYELESEQDRRREDEARPGMPYAIAARKAADLAGLDLSDKQLERLALAFPYGLAIQWAPLYPLLRRRISLGSVAAGLATGAAMSLVADEMMTPALGSAPPTAPTRCRRTCAASLGISSSGWGSLPPQRRAGASCGNAPDGRRPERPKEATLGEPGSSARPGADSRGEDHKHAHWLPAAQRLPCGLTRRVAAPQDSALKTLFDTHETPPDHTAAQPHELPGEFCAADGATVTAVARRAPELVSWARHRPVKPFTVIPAGIGPATLRLAVKVPRSGSGVIRHSPKSSQRPVSGNQALKTLSLALNSKRSQATPGWEAASRARVRCSSGRVTTCRIPLGRAALGSASTPTEATTALRATAAAR